MDNNAEKLVSKFYNTGGWKAKDNITEDAKRWEDLRPFSAEYISKCRLRVLEHIPSKGEFILDMASGPIQYKEYLEYSKGFNKRYCIDLSKEALVEAQKKIGEHGKYFCGSFFDIDLENNFFDCSISLHTIYHIDKDKQEEAVWKLLNVTKPGCPVIIVYSNPKTLIKKIILPMRLLFSLFKKDNSHINNGDIYFFTHPIDWWARFNAEADILILPWRSFSGELQKTIIPNNRFGKRILNYLFNMEGKYPQFFVRHFQFPMIVLKKKLVL
ncbi:MAG: class I SAM-dependent methyltransferase [Bacteroidales bacterium]|jgi:ubiquinone/menaquinone biosynthesis C-methylase UbiE|nr:class I SAM-dependent methyltransferase [Bacteroidales bacterium]